MKKKKEFNLGIVKGTCVDYSHDGKGIIKQEGGKPIFVDGLLLNETADVKLTYETSSLIYGKVVKLYNLSKDRIKPLCPVGSACGGCCFQNLSYKAQLDFKKKKVEESFKRIGHMSIKVDEIYGMKDPYHYRNKIQMPVGLNQKKEIIMGLYRTKSHEIIPISECYIEDIRAKDIIDNLKKLMKKHRIMPYDEDKREGIIRHVLIKTSHSLPQIMVVLVTNVDVFPGRNNLVKDLHNACPNITTIVQNINNKDTNVILGEKERILLGSGFIRDSILGVTFQISAKSFFQVNPTQTEVLYDLAIKGAKLEKDDVILDAFCGIGTIGLIASKYVKKVIGVEVIEDAIKDAKNNARLNNITNAEFYASDASVFINELLNNKESIDVVFVDPPRKGLEKSFIDDLIKLSPQRIVYVSCDPSTLARDIELLSKDYSITSINAVDMFPMTFHVETVVALKKTATKAAAK